MKTTARTRTLFRQPSVKRVIWLIVLCAFIYYGAQAMKPPLTQISLPTFLDQYAGSNVPGLQYMVMDKDHVLFEYAGGWADIQNKKPMTLETTMMGYSMTKTLTAAAVLQLVEQGKVGLDDPVSMYLPDQPYGDQITIRQLLDHTSGIPNPIPLRWVHLTEDAEGFNEDAALDQVLSANPELDFEAGAKFSYSNIGYWLLGKVIEQATGQIYSDYMHANILSPLEIPHSQLDFVIPSPTQHAKGYLAKYSFLNLGKGFVTDSQFWGEYEGNWLNLKSHHLNGPSFGGLVGTARGFGIFLQDQLQARSVLFDQQTKVMFETQQTDSAGKPIPMTLGWHIGTTDGVTYLFKEGGGGGFHAEMRLYPTLGITSIVMVNSTEFNSTEFLNKVDHPFITANP
jgi:CubicO group peptidase (beta-lactamase class C family)